MGFVLYLSLCVTALAGAVIWWNSSKEIQDEDGNAVTPRPESGGGLGHNRSAGAKILECIVAIVLTMAFFVLLFLTIRKFFRLVEKTLDLNIVMTTGMPQPLPKEDIP